MSLHKNSKIQPMNSGALRHPALVVKVKTAILEATRKAAWSNPAIVDVMNNKGVMVLRVSAWEGKGFEVYDRLDNDVTEAVKEALCEYHADIFQPSKAPHRGSGMMTKPAIPYRAILSVRNPKGVLCRLPMIAYGMDADEAGGHYQGHQQRPSCHQLWQRDPRLARLPGSPYARL